MPPGWDGIETINQLWRVDPDLQVVICTAYSDHSWSEIIRRLAPTDGLLILRKPFDAVEIRQLAHTLTTKWTLRQQARKHLYNLQAEVKRRTLELVKTTEELKRESAGARAHRDRAAAGPEAGGGGAGGRRASPTRSARRCSSWARAWSCCGTRSPACTR